jgi:hypothetical protein
MLSVLGELETVREQDACLCSADALPWSRRGLKVGTVAKGISAIKYGCYVSNARVLRQLLLEEMQLTAE